MQIPILIEPIDGERWRATAGGPFNLTADGASRQEAVQNLERLVAMRFEAGAAVLAMNVPPTSPVVPARGPMKYDDPDYDAWLKNTAAKRKVEDEAAAMDEAALDAWFWRTYQEGVDELRRKDDEELGNEIESDPRSSLVEELRRKDDEELHKQTDPAEA